jgi:chemotaxis protein MotB
VARKKKAQEHANHERWLVSYADFITLLFATFTALYAISNADMAKFKEMAVSINRAFNGKSSTISPITLDANAKGNGDMVIQIVESPFSKPDRGAGDVGRRGGDQQQAFDPVANLAVKSRQDQPAEPGATPAPTPPSEKAGAILSPTANPSTPEAAASAGPAEQGAAEGKANDALASQLQQWLSAIGLAGKVEVRRETRGTVISLGEAAFFAPGGIDVLAPNVHTLDNVLNALRGKDFEVRIEGHTDNAPVPAGRPYRSNEELSSLRASRIMEFMIKEYGFPGDKLSVAGFGPWRPIADNATDDGRRKNRRVDLVILNKSEIARDPH